MSADLFPKSKAQLNREKYEAQAKAATETAAMQLKRKREYNESRRPAFGSQQWAETRGDDLGDSIDC